MSNSIASVNQLVTVIRYELGKAAGRAVAPARQDARTQRHGSRYAEHNLPALIEVRIRQIERDDPQRGQKAFRVFLEIVLLSTLGEQMVTDPRFHQLVDDVQRAMESEAGCARLVDEAITHLLNQNE